VSPLASGKVEKHQKQSKTVVTSRTQLKGNTKKTAEKNSLCISLLLGCCSFAISQWKSRKESEAHKLTELPQQ
jgi:hypothetical protein